MKRVNASKGSSAKSNYLQTERAKKTKGKSVKVGGTVIIKEKGKEPLKFKKGGLKKELGVSQENKIPAAKMKEAESGKYGKSVKKKAMFAENVLSKGRKTAANNRKSKSKVATQQRFVISRNGSNKK